MIQVAGVMDSDDLKIILESGVDFVGFPLRLAYHRPDLSEAEAAALIRKIAEPTEAVLITYLDQAAEIKKFCEFLNVSVLQLHGEISIDEVQKLKKLAPNLKIIKSLIVGKSSLAEIESEVGTFSPLVDYFITDTFDPQTGAMGATGKTHDWQISKKIVELSGRPVILAGGLNPKNVAEAIRIVRPAGVDVHTGVENPQGRKDPVLLKQFVRAASSAFKKLSSTAST